jgi:hypothetical protein
MARDIQWCTRRSRASFATPRRIRSPRAGWWPALGFGREKLLAPLAQQTVGNVVLATAFGHRLRATQRREHDLRLLLGGELPLLADLA